MVPVPQVDASSDAVVVAVRVDELVVTFQLTPEAAQEFSRELFKAAMRVERAVEARDNG